MILDKYNANVKIAEAPPNYQIFFCSEKWQVDGLISGRGCVQRSYSKFLFTFPTNIVKLPTMKF